MMLRFALASSVVALVACGGSDSGTSSELTVQTIDKRETSGVDAAQTLVVRDPATWAALWAQHASTLSPAPAVPAVDFSQRQVLAVFLGARPTSCYSVEVVRVVEDAMVTTVEFHETGPQPFTACAALVTHPAHLATVVNTKTPVQFTQK